MDALMETQRRRILIILGIFLGMTILLIGRLVQWQIIQHGSLLQRAVEDARAQRIIPPQRGIISDADGRIMAIDVRADTIVADPYIVRLYGQTQELAQRLSPRLGKTPDAIVRSIDEASSSVLIKGPEKLKAYAILDEAVTPGEIEAVQQAIASGEPTLRGVFVKDGGVMADPYTLRKERRIEEVAKQLASLLHASIGDIAEGIYRAGRYVVLARDLSLDDSTAVIQEVLGPDGKEGTGDDLIGVYREEGYRRIYPYGALAAHVVGFLNANGSGIGVEEMYKTELAGTPGRFKAQSDGTGRPLPGSYEEYIPPIASANLSLTIKIPIQYIAERELDRMLAAEKAITGTVIVLDAQTGAILAMASRPTFNPNNFAAAQPNQFSNVAINQLYDPGSVFKIVTVAAALEAGAASPQSTYWDPGSIKFHGRTISNSNQIPPAQVSLARALQYSSNVVMVRLVQDMGAEKFYQYVRAFGFGQSTGVDLPGEMDGLVLTPGDPLWSLDSLATNSFGQGLSATPLQMAMAVATVANGGVLLRPYIVGRVSRPGGEQVRQPTVVRTVLSRQNAQAVTAMLTSVVDSAVRTASVAGYRVAGKTGTAETYTSTGIDRDRVITSFGGYVPADNPRFVILVRIDNPRIHDQGSEVAAPVFRNIAQYLLAYAGIPPGELQAQR